MKDLFVEVSHNNHSNIGSKLFIAYYVHTKELVKEKQDRTKDRTL